jgi:Protein of unknown function (DUF1353)
MLTYLALEGVWQLDHDVTVYGNEESWVVPAGFKTDLASSPRALWWLIGPYGPYLFSALVHDWMYEQWRNGNFKRVDADGIFRRNLRQDGVRKVQRWFMWTAVRFAGGPKQWLDSPPLDRLKLLVLSVVGIAFVGIPFIVITIMRTLVWLINRIGGR